MIEAAESAGFAIKGILDVAERIGDDVLGYKIVGTDDDAALYAAECDFVVTLGFIKSAAIRNHIIDKLTATGCRFATVVASTAHVSRHATLGEGTVVLHRATVNAGASVGRHCIINTAANVDDGAHVSTGAMLNGESRVGAGAFVGSGAVLAQCVAVGAGSVIGAGSVVTVSLTEPGIYAGNPARLINKKK